jgi:hypothetical protein
MRRPFLLPAHAPDRGLLSEPVPAREPHRRPRPRAIPGRSRRDHGVRYTRPMPPRRPNYDRKLARVLVHNLAGNPLTGNKQRVRNQHAAPGNWNFGMRPSHEGHDAARA